MATQLQVTVNHAETGEAYVLHFSPAASVDDLRREASEYTGVNPKSMILLNGAPPHARVEARTPLGELREVFMYNKDSLSRRTSAALTATAGATPTNPAAATSTSASGTLMSGSMSDSPTPTTTTTTTTNEPTSDLDAILRMSVDPNRRDAEALQEACEACAARCRVQLRAARAAVVNLVDHTTAIARVYRKFRDALEDSHERHGAVLASLEPDIKRLEGVRYHAAALAGAGGNATPTTPLTLLDALTEQVEAWRRTGQEAERQRGVIFTKAEDIAEQLRTIEQGTAEANAVPLDSLEVDELESVAKDADAAVERKLEAARKFRLLELSASRALLATLRRVALLQRRIQDLANSVAALKEAETRQETVVASLEGVARLPEAYRRALEEADRRRAFVRAYMRHVQRLADFVARERDAELERRDAFKRDVGKHLPDNLVPGLVPGFFPPCEVTQREVDADLFKSGLVSPAASSTSVFSGLASGVATGTTPPSGFAVPAPPPPPPATTSASASASADVGAMGDDPFELLMAKFHLERSRGNNDKADVALRTLQAEYERDVQAHRSRVAELEAALERERALRVGASAVTTMTSTMPTTTVAAAKPPAQPAQDEAAAAEDPEA